MKLAAVNFITIFTLLLNRKNNSHPDIWTLPLLKNVVFFTFFTAPYLFSFMQSPIFLSPTGLPNVATSNHLLKIPPLKNSNFF